MANIESAFLESLLGIEKRSQILGSSMRVDVGVEGTASVENWHLIFSSESRHHFADGCSCCFGDVHSLPKRGTRRGTRSNKQVELGPATAITDRGGVKNEGSLRGVGGGLVLLWFAFLVTVSWGVSILLTCTGGPAAVKTSRRGQHRNSTISLSSRSDIFSIWSANEYSWYSV